MRGIPPRSPFALAFVVALGAAAAPARADTFVVDTTATDDDGSCDPAPGDCTLPEAIAAASAQPGRDAITFDSANAGILIGLDNTENKISGNTADSNGGFDLEDENPDCDANRWSKNAFGSANEACIE